MTEDVKNSHEPNSGWASLVCSILAGWNVGLLAAFLTAIGLGVGLRSFIQIVTGNTSFFLVVATSISLGILFGIVVGRKLYPWFSRHSRFAGYFWLIALIIFSALSLPASFSFVST